MILRCLLASLLIFAPCFSEDFLVEHMFAQTTEVTDPTSLGIQGIFLTSNKEDVLPEGRPTMTGIRTMDIEIPGGEANIASALQPLLGKKVTKKNVIAIKQAIMTYYVKQGVSMIGVELPAQKTKGGVIQFLVIQKKFGKPVFKGDTFYSENKLSESLGVSTNMGQTIAEDVLQNNLSWINRNPFQNTQIKYVPGAAPDELDIEFISKKRRQIRLYERADNTGSSTIGYGQFATGFAWGNAFWIGDLLSFEYQFSSEFKRLQSFTLNYTSYLPWKNIFSVLGTYVIIKPSSPASLITAKAGQIRPRYTIPFKPLYTPFMQSVTLGVDWKYSNTSSINLAGSAPVLEPTVQPAVLHQIEVFQLNAEYTASYTIGKHSLYFDGAFYASPAKFLGHQSDPIYNANTPHSKVKYYYFDATIGDVITIPKVMSISLLARGQIASQTLPSTELFVLGGYNTVRGYHESELATDNGFCGNIELRTPKYPFFQKIKGKIQFLTFFDYGVGNNWYVKPSKRMPPKTQYLMGTGLGLRYSIAPYLQVRFDYGFKLKQLFIPNKQQNSLLLGFGQGHVGVLASY